MAGNFLNLEDDDFEPVKEPLIGAGLKGKTMAPRRRADPKAVAKAGEAHGFTRTTDPKPPAPVPAQAPRRGRPPLKDEMTYWRIYVSPDLRDRLNVLRDQEGRRLNDVLQDMLDAYVETKA